MTITIAGVFDDASDARDACQKLETAGIDRQSIQLTEGDAPSSAPAGGDGKPGGIRRFFAELFGTDNDEASGQYAEAVHRGSAVLTVHGIDEQRVDEVKDALEDCGAIDIEQRVEQWRSGGWTGYDENAPRQRAAGERGGDDVLPVVEEELKVGKRQVQRGGVRVHRHTSERPVEQQVSLRDERVVVERQAVDRPATDDELRNVGDRVVEVRETAEEPVVSKSARVVEEVRVGKQTRERSETVRDKLRRTDVDVEQMPGGAPSLQRDMEEQNVAASLRSYSGPERRRTSGAGYAGAERRA